MGSTEFSEASAGTARARLANGTWQVGTSDIQLGISTSPGNRLVLSHLAASDTAGWSTVPGASPFTLVLDGIDVTSGMVVESSRTWADDRAVRVEIVLRTKGDHHAFFQLECHDGQSIVRQWLEVEPSTAVTVSRVEPVRLCLSPREVQTLHTVSGVQQQGGWRPEEGPYNSFQLQSSSLEAPLRRHSGLRSTWDETPWAALTGQQPGGILAALEYGGQWEMRAGRDATTDAVTIGFAPDGIQPRVQAGERWVSPAGWIGLFPGDLDSAAAVMHRYLRDTVVPPTGTDFPWVQYNTWFSWFCELDEETLLAEADRAADLGVEVFYVDAGWWVSNPLRRDRFSSGLGNWVENRDKFPGGLRAFADAIRERGMHFGIWVEPERVDMRTATTGTWKPEWIARKVDGTYVRCDWPQDTDTAWLCYGHPETQAWAEAWIGNLVEELDVRWLKWDSNYWDVCTSADHGHGATDGERAQLEGVYLVMDQLRSRFPDLIIENCAGGATRLDFAISRHTHTAWLNDASEPAHRSRFHNAGASYLFPPAMLNAWVTESQHENVNRQDLPDPVWRSVIRSRMLGAIGFSCRLGSWSEMTQRIAREEVTRYKEEIRPLLRTGALYHLLPQPSIPSQDLPTPDVWEAYQVSAEDDRTHVVLAFRNASPDVAIIVPLRVSRDVEYVVEAEGQPAARHSGRDLCTTGLRLECPLLSSAWVTVRVAEGSAG